MKRLIRQDFVDGLRSVGLAEGDAVFVQSCLGKFGMIENPLETVYQSFCEVLGPEGTLAVPAFNFNCFKGEVFDVNKTPSETGVFSEYIRMHPQARRSYQPPWHSIVALGRFANQLARARSLTSFGRDSVFGLMYDRAFKVCMFGTTFRDNTFFHYIEEQARVPYRNYIDVAPIIRMNGRESTYHFRYFARPIAPILREGFERVGDAGLTEYGGRRTIIGYGYVYMASVVKMVDASLERLHHDPFYLLLPEDRKKAQLISK